MRSNTAVKTFLINVFPLNPILLFFYASPCFVLTFFLSVQPAEAADAQIQSPTANTAFTSQSPVISWSGNGVDDYWLYAGSTAGGRQYLDSGNIGSATNATVTGLPGDGSTVHIRLWYRENGGNWQYVDQQNSAKTVIIESPTPNTQLSGTALTFFWPNTTADRFWLYLGSTIGGYDYDNSGDLGSSTSHYVDNLPADGSTVHARLWFKMNGGRWYYVDTQFTAFGSSISIETPSNGDTLLGSQVAFEWPSASADRYWLYLGNTQGSRSIHDSGNLGANKSTTVSGLPVNGSTIYARLWYQFGNNAWQYTDSSYQAAAGGLEISKLIVADQFGYLPARSKVAVLRNPQTGYDSAQSYTPQNPISVVRVSSNQTVYSGNAVAWNNGATDTSSGDKVWWFDFSSVTSPGTYQIVDADAGLASTPFEISNDVYDDVLRHAVRTFYYQRSGLAKTTPYADARWTDSASHLGPLQDSQARRYNAAGDASTQRDLRGGWYDAGDYNKYTNWTAEYVISLLHSYIENIAIWTDDFGIPESGNGIPDLIDEIRWGVDWLKRMQNADGSVLSIVGVDHASPPSAATGQSLYGTANTSATLNTAAAFALASTVFSDTGIGSLSSYANELRNRAEDAWDWAVANPNVTFQNNDAAFGTQGLGAGQQEVDAFKLSMIKLGAAIYLTDLTGASEYNNYVVNNYQGARLLLWTYVDPYEQYPQRDLLYYANLSSTATSIRNNILNTYVAAMNASWIWGAVDTEKDPYRSQLDIYGWGSNREKSSMGMLYQQLVTNNIGTRSANANRDVASDYLHYLHGVNPQGLVYLSNMASAQAERSVDTFYHGWFHDGSANWDSVKDSLHGPAPGFLVGGPNPGYSWDLNTCGSGGNTGICGNAILSPPANQPDQKSYLEFNDSWPLNSWEVTENSNGYQTAYIRLLAQFVSGN